MNFDPKPRGYSVIVVDEAVVKCGGQPLYVCVVDAEARQPILFSASFTRSAQSALEFLWRLRKRCLGDPMIFHRPRTLVP
jgi:transposase-like protein